MAEVLGKEQNQDSGDLVSLSPLQNDSYLVTTQHHLYRYFLLLLVLLGAEQTEMGSAISATPPGSVTASSQEQLQHGAAATWDHAVGKTTLV